MIYDCVLSDTDTLSDDFEIAMAENIMDIVPEYTPLAMIGDMDTLSTIVGFYGNIGMWNRRA